MAATVDPHLLEVLACPADHHAPLRMVGADGSDAGGLHCSACGRTYPIVDGIPVLLLTEASGGPDTGE